MELIDQIMSQISDYVTDPMVVSNLQVLCFKRKESDNHEQFSRFECDLIQPDTKDTK
jgi:hypothetical protein